MHTLQFVVGALKTNTDNDIFGVVLYPFVFPSGDYPNRPATFNISLGASCSSAVQSLEDLSYSVFYGGYQSEETRSYDALKYLMMFFKEAKKEATTVITLSGGASETHNIPESSNGFPIIRIASAIRKIRVVQPDIQFFAAGININTLLDLLEVFALSESIPSHSVIIRTSQDLTGEVVDLLVDANILCPSQGEI